MRVVRRLALFGVFALEDDRSLNSGSYVVIPIRQNEALRQLAEVKGFSNSLFV